MKKIKIRKQNGFDLMFTGEQIARIDGGLGVIAFLWKTKGGKYVFEIKVEHNKSIDVVVLNSAKDTVSWLIDKWGEGGKRLIKAAQSKDRAFEGLIEELVE